MMTTTYILYELVEDISNNKDNFNYFCKAIPNNFIISHFLFIFSFVLRCHRIIECCKINFDERTEINQFYNRRFLFRENFYLKILLVGTIIVAFLNFLSDILYPQILIIPYHFLRCIEDYPDASFAINMFWVIIMFIEGAVLLTYSFNLSINPIRQSIKFELYAFTIIWIIPPNCLKFGEFFIIDIQTSHWVSYISFMFLYVLLFINGYFPIILSYIHKKNIGYNFNSKLSTNLYLFLSNESCVLVFWKFLRTHYHERGQFFLDLYIDINKFKLKYTTLPNYSDVIEEGKAIYEKYFSHTQSGTHSRSFESSSNTLDFLPFEIVNKIKSNCQILHKNDCNYEMFDEALLYAYEYLEDRFIEFKRRDEFQIINDNLNLSSYINCKMSNTGLINKF
jgi:hypothetical protein